MVNEKTMTRRKGSLQLEKNGIWTARVTVDGRTMCRSTGTTMRAEAEMALARLVVLAECGRKRTLERAALLKAWPRYEASSAAARLAQSSRNTKYRAWVHFSVWMNEMHPEVKDPQGVTRRMAEEYLSVFQGGHAPVTCNLRICLLREMFRFFLEDAETEDNPWDGIRLRAADGYTRRELTLEEVRRLIVAATACGREWRMLFSLAIYTGMRLGDCCRLKWESVNLEASIMQIVPHKTRRYLAGRPVTIPLHSELEGMLTETPEGERSGFVMGKIAEDFTLHRWSISRKLAKIFAAAGITTSVMIEGRERRTPEATFHSLRHTFVSIAVNAGVPLATVQSIVGHTSTAMTRHYYHPNEEALRQAVDAIPPIGREGRTPPRPFGSREGRASPRPLRWTPRPTLCARLKELEKAKKKGLISSDEFALLRQGVLAEA